MMAAAKIRVRCHVILVGEKAGKEGMTCYRVLIWRANRWVEI